MEGRSDRQKLTRFEMSDTPDAVSRPLPAVELHGFAAVPARLVADRSISHTELRLLLALAAHAGPTQECWPGVERLAAIIDVTGRQVRRVLRSLEAAGYVQVFKRKKPDGTQTSNLYRLRFARWDTDGHGEAPPPPGGREIPEEDPDKNVRPAGAECQGPPDTIVSAKPLQENQDKDNPLIPPQSGGLSGGEMRLTRKEQKRLEVLEKALAVKATCADCGNSIRPVRDRDQFGRYAPGVAWYEGRGYVHTGCVSEPPTVYRISHKIGRDGFTRGRLVIES